MGLGALLTLTVGAPMAVLIQPAKRRRAGVNGMADASARPTATPQEHGRRDASRARSVHAFELFESARTF